MASIKSQSISHCCKTSRYLHTPSVQSQGLSHPNPLINLVNLTNFNDWCILLPLRLRNGKLNQIWKFRGAYDNQFSLIMENLAHDSMLLSSKFHLNKCIEVPRKRATKSKFDPTVWIFCSAYMIPNSLNDIEVWHARLECFFDTKISQWHCSKLTKFQILSDCSW